MGSLLRAKEEIQNCIEFRLCWEFFPQDVILCKNVHLNFLLKWQQCRVFLNVFPFFFAFGFRRDCVGRIDINHP